VKNRTAKKRPHSDRAKRRPNRNPAIPSGDRRSAVVVSHGPFCLDGVTAAACVGRFYGESRVTPVFTHPSDVDRVIREVARKTEGPRDLWIADITWKRKETEEVFKELVPRGWRIFWMDHHTIALEKSEEEIKALGLTGWVASNQFSAARLLYNYLISAGDLLGKAPSSLKRFKKIVLLADDNDRWVHHLRGSRELAMTVAALGGTAAYREFLQLDGDVRYSPRMKEAFRTAHRELSDSVALAIRTRTEKTTEDGLKIVTALCKGYTSEVAEAIGKTVANESGPDAVRAIFLLYNLDDQRISLRETPSCGVNLARLAGRFGGGGHPAAAGFDLPEAQDYLQNFLADRLAQALKEYGQGA
jgi:oligoribonuclease NrnB/cAMP/cGMP phosphodiesterase (DHH superfamily)